MNSAALIEAVVAGSSPASLVEQLLESSSFSITRGDLDRLYNRYARHDQDLRYNLDFLFDYESEHEEDDPGQVERVLDLLTKAGREALGHVRAPYVNIDDLKVRLLSRRSLWDRMADRKSMLPIAVYVSSGPSDHATIGLEVSENGKLEMFEGNDEATPETIELVNDLLGLGSKRVTVFGSHDEKVVDHIREKGQLPKDLYVSPNKNHAAGYWGEGRVLFSCEITLGCVSQESNVDWRVIKPADIKKFKYV